MLNQKAQTESNTQVSSIEALPIPESHPTYPTPSFNNVGVHPVGLLAMIIVFYKAVVKG